MKKHNNVIYGNKQFALSRSPLSYIISVHMQNLMLTFGEEQVKKIVEELFFSSKTKNANSKKTSNA